jgi:hypothetical protein
MRKRKRHEVGQLGGEAVRQGAVRCRGREAVERSVRGVCGQQSREALGM